MLLVILLLIVGTVLVYLSQFNFEPVTVNVGFYIFSNVPLFFVICASIVAGMILVYVMHLSYVFSQTLAFRKKTKELNENKDEVLELTKRVHQLELENEKLKKDFKANPSDPRAL